MGVPRVVQARMVTNAIVDALLGLVPGVGNVADIFWKSNAWNMRLLEPHARPGVPHTRFDAAFVWDILAALLLAALIPILFVPWGFDLMQVEELNRRYGNPLVSPSEVQALRALVGGQPFLTRRALDVVKRPSVDVQRFPVREFFTMALTSSAFNEPGTRDDAHAQAHLRETLTARRCVEWPQPLWRGA